MEVEMESASGHGGSIFRKCQRPVVLKFEDVFYKIKTKPEASESNTEQKRISERTILKGICGAVLPGEMLAMMGPSGSGKTTLLTALGGRFSSSSLLTGAITYNGAAYSSSLKRNMGFVAQDDILYPHLTVQETLLYTALLRLPCSLSKQDKAAHVEAVIAQLGLMKCRNSIIGGSLIRGISGGERKRVSIGQEMLIDPGLLLLDEPTSGLDSTTALRIVSVVGELAKGGRTIVMTIHQPSSHLYYMFQKVLLLSDGYPVYFGLQSEAMEYFASFGHTPLVAMNPADFLLDLANGIDSDESRNKNQAEVKEELISAYNFHLQKRIKSELARIIVEESREHKQEKGTNQWNSSWWTQFTVLTERDLKERKHEAFSKFTVLQVLAISLVAGAIWWHSKHVPDQAGLLFFVSGFWGSFPLYQAIFTFPQERRMLAKERSSGMYRLSSYFMAKMVADLPMSLILPAVSTVIYYWMGGLKATAANFFMFLAIILLCVLVTYGLGLALGAAIMDVKAASTCASVVMLTFMLAGGFYVQNVPVFIGWIKYISYIFYNFKLLLASQYKHTEMYECGRNMSCRVADYPSIKTVGLNQRGLAVGVMLLMFVFYRVVAYIALMRVGVAK